MELLNGGDLQKRIGQVGKGVGAPFAEAEIWRAMVHLAKGLQSLHDANVVHRDLKCANVFLSTDGTFKLGDLNVSKVAKMGLVYT
jgi:NIMA (never in mitosis gene a)-related kinase 1/4/5